MQLSVLGPLEVSDAGRTLEISGVRLRRLLLRLGVDKQRVVSAEQLVVAVWGTALAGRPTDQINALQTLISRLRRTLGAAAEIQQVPGGYRLASQSELTTDVELFCELAEQARRALAGGDPGLAADLFARGLDLWRGPALADAGDAEYARPLAAKWEEQRLDVQAERVEARLLLGPDEALIADLEALAGQFTIREQFTGQLMAALAAAGRPAEALAAYERLRTFLADELGSDPGESLQAAHLALLRATGLATAAVTGAPTAPRSIGMTERLARRTNLRASLTSFLGREDELARLSGLLRAGRLATVVGPGGAGKTRLAGVAAAEWTEELTDGVWFVELAPVTDEANIAQAILGSLGVRANQVIERSSVDLQRMTAEDRLVEVLSPSECLLVIDNCEHLIDAVAKLADRLLALCPELRILATSREPLGIDGEALCLLSPLTLPPPGVGAQAALGYPAVQLLADRAAAVSAEFAVDESTVAAVVEIVRRLDGLPLAIELAAARLRVLPVSEVAARLTDRFRLLTGGSRASMPRHRTLRAVVEWSWELLTPPERLLAERLAIFPSGATIDSVVAICADERLRAAEISSLLDALVDKSLLRLVEADRPAAEGAVNSVGGPGQPGSGQPGSGWPGQPNSASGMRYRMLETIREYGAEKLSEHHEVRQVRLAHALHFAELVARAEPWLRRAEQLTWFNELNRERDNILAALRFLGESGLADQTIAMASSLGWYWTLLGNHGEAATWMGFALEVPGGTPGQERTLAECLHAISLMGTTFGDASEEELAESMAQIAVLRERLLEVDAQLSPMVSLLRSIMAFFAGDDEGLTRLLEESLREGDPWVQAASLMFRAHFWENKGEVERMVADAEKSFELFTAIGDRWGLASTLSTLAMAHTLGGELDAAISEYEQAVRYLSQFGAVDDAAMMHLRLTDLQLRNGDLAAAKREAALARSTDFQSGSRAQRLLSDTALSAIAVVEGDVIAAAQYRQLLGDQLKQLGSRHPIDGHVRAIALAALGRLELLAGEADLAGASLLEAYQVGIETLDMPIVAGVAVAIARYAEFRGRAVDAAEILGAAARLRGSDDPTDVAVRSLSERLRQTLPEQFAVCYQRGKDLDRQAALARVDPSSLAVC